MTCPTRSREHFADDRFGDIKLRFVVEHEPLGTAGGIRFAAEGHRRAAARLQRRRPHRPRPRRARGVPRRAGAPRRRSRSPRSTDPSAFGVVPTRDDGEVVAFVEKPPPRPGADATGSTPGTYVLEPEVLDAIPPRLTVSIERETFPRMLEQPGRLYAMRSDAYWLDIGTPQKYLAGPARRGPGPARAAAGAGRDRARATGSGSSPAPRSSSPTRRSRRAAPSSAPAPGSEPGARVEASVLGPGATVGEGAVTLLALGRATGRDGRSGRSV